MDHVSRCRPLWLPLTKDTPSLLSEACRTLHEFKCTPTSRSTSASAASCTARKPSHLGTVVSRALRFLHDDARCTQLKRVLQEHIRSELFAVVLRLPQEEKQRRSVLRHLREQGFFALHWTGLLGLGEDGSSA